MKTLLTLAFLSVLTVPVMAQIACIPFGALSTCSGPGLDQTQVPLGRNQGVIITDHDTVPYTIIQPAPRTRFDPTPLPTMPRPNSVTIYGQTDSSGNSIMVLPNDPGLGNGLGVFGGGLLGE